MKIAGHPVPHESARGHVTGEALFTGDLASRFPRLLHAWPVMVPYAHAQIVSCDPTAALAVDGVVHVLTAADVPGEGDSGPVRHDEPLFPGEVLHHSQAVAWVLGETLDAARAGAEKVCVNSRQLPAILTIEDAVACGSFHSRPLVLERGDSAAALAASEHRLTGEIHMGGQEHFYLETQCTIAWADETGGISLHCSTQHPAETQEIVARTLGVPRHMVTVECLRMGGAFGGKETQANACAAIAALGAWKTARPVLVQLPRRLDMILTGKRHPFLVRFSAGYNSEGKITSLDAVLYADGGWSLDLSEAILGRAMFHIDNAYFIPALTVTGHICKTHKTSQTAFRGFGGPQGMLAVEDILDRIARSLRLAPELVRERNFYQPGQCTHYGQTVKDAGRIALIWNQLKETSSFAARRNAIAVFNAANNHTKRGMAITPVKFGISFTATLFNQAGALVLVYRDGSVQLNHGGTEMGQGLHTKMIQVAAECLGIPAAAIRQMPARTDKIPNTSATAASSGSDLNGAAIFDACGKIKATLSLVACEMLGCAVEAVQFEDGMVFATGAEAKTFRDVVEAAYRKRLPLFASGFYRTPEIHYDPKTLQGQPFYYFSYGAAVTEVEIDGFTGEYSFPRVDILEDTGDSLSPMVDRGQIEGGFIQGLGWLTLEELLWDDAGRLATNSASTYKLPSWSEVPEVFNVDFLNLATAQGVIFGSKAVGEPPLMLALSAREAIKDAVAAFGPGGVVEIDSPCTPERVYFAIERARGPKPAAESMEAAVTIS